MQVDAIEWYTKKLSKLEDKIILAQEGARTPTKANHVAFITSNTTFLSHIKCYPKCKNYMGREGERAKAIALAC